MLVTRLTSSLEKIFPDTNPADLPALSHIRALRGERISAQLSIMYEPYTPELGYPRRAPLILGGSLAPYATVRQVMFVPVNKTLHPLGADDNYSRTKLGLFPDILRPLYYGGKVTLTHDMTQTVWVEIALPEDAPVGEGTLTLSLDYGEFGQCCETLTVDVIGATLPREGIDVTQWFHADCLANYYNVEVWSDRHFEIVEAFARTAVRGGINTLLTPIFTPPLDTAVGGERRTTQLVGITRCGGEYTFDYTLLDRWIDMCDRVGIKNLEIAHFFTQWGAAHAPKIMATVDGEYKKLFGWETDATGEEYATFLRALIPSLLAHLKARGDDRRCFFHISDEPNIDHLENYRAARAIVAPMLEGYVIMDALSRYDFYKQGIVDHPVPASNHIEPFLEGGVPDLWTYYCVSQPLEVSNRYDSMPGWRNRSMGMQMYVHNIAGFLHWGYNFYSNQYSGDPINPYYEQSADHAFPGGDAFSVYPAMDGTALESPRFLVFFEGLQDIRAMRLLEGYIGREATVALVKDAFGGEITFRTCAKDGATVLRVREAVNAAIAKAVAGA